jgi:membrane protease YdiL (CAAX protease family)
LNEESSHQPPRSTIQTDEDSAARGFSGSSPDPFGLFLGPDGLRPAWCLLLFLAIAYCVYLFSGSMLISTPAVYRALRAAAGRPSTLLTLLVNDGPLLLSVVVATWTMSAIEDRPVSSYGLGGTRRIPLLLAGFAWGAISLSLFLAFLWKAGWLVFDGRILTGGEIPKQAAIWIVGFALVSLTEEYTLRGYLQFTLARTISALFDSSLGASRSRALGFWTTALFLSFLFGAGHSNNPGESPIGLLSAGLIGLVFCLSLWRTGSLWWALGFHASWDWAQSFLFGVADSGTMVQGHLLATHPAGKVLMSGGATGPEGSLFVLPVLALMTLIVFLTLPQSQSRA